MHRLARLLLLLALPLAACDNDVAAPEARTAAPAVAAVVLAPAAGGLVFDSVSTGTDHSCGLTSAGEAYCWGYNYYGQLGHGTQSNCPGSSGCSTIPVKVAGGLTFKSVTAGSYHSCGITTTGQAWCWGKNDAGQLGAPTATTCGIGDPCSYTPIAVAGSITFAQIDGGNHYTCGVDVAGKGYCWGYNMFAQGGNGGTGAATTPTPVAGGLVFRQIDAGLWHTCGTTTSDQAWCWGRDDAEQLGAAAAGTCTFNSIAYVCSTTPVRVAGTTSFRRVAAGGQHSCALTPTGQPYCWGTNYSGQVGDSTYVVRPAPTAVKTTSLFRTISASFYHNCAVATTGETMCWGNNVHGETGTGSTNSPLVPEPVLGGLTWRSAAAGEEHSCGVAADGSAWCWGKETRGELGNGNGRQEITRVPLAVAGPLLGDSPPVAKFFVVGCVNLSCTVNASTSTDDVGIVSYTWTFGDGTTATGYIGNHTYLASGTYRVTLTVADSAGQTSSALADVTVYFDASCSNTTCSFAGGDPNDPTISSFAWNFGDGTTGTGASATHTYATGGTYQVQLKVTDKTGRVGTSTRTVSPTGGAPNQPPVARFGYTCDVAQHKCFFDASTSTDDAGVTGYSWASSIAGYPVKSGATTFRWTGATSPRTWLETVTVTDAQGLTHSITKAIIAPEGTNKAPTVAITAPGSGASVPAGQSVTFTGTATDPELGALSGNAVTWTSSLDGVLGKGTSLSTAALRAGTHTITLAATDTLGAVGSTTRTLIVTGAPANKPPVASFTATCNATQHYCDLNASGSTDADGRVVSYTWSAPNRPTKTGATVRRWTLVSGQGQTYSETLTVTDDKGATHAITKTVVIP